MGRERTGGRNLLSPRERESRERMMPSNKSINAMPIYVRRTRGGMELCLENWWWAENQSWMQCCVDVLCGRVFPSLLLCWGYRGTGADTFLYFIGYVYGVCMIWLVDNTVYIQYVLRSTLWNFMDRVCIPWSNRYIQEQIKWIVS